MKSINFELVNPYIEGNFKKIFSDNNSILAAQKCYINLSKYIRNPMPKFYYTLRDMKSGQYHHFIVKEKANKNNNASYKIEEINIDNNKKELEQFENNINEFRNKKGGLYIPENDNDDDDLFEEDTELYKSHYNNIYNHRKDQPILYYWYDPYIYKINTLYIPHFVLPLTPLVQVNLSSAFF
jgi:hypothetical protein